jgi:glycosidase
MLLVKNACLSFKNVLGLCVFTSILACTPSIENLQTAKIEQSTLPKHDVVSPTKLVGKPVVYQVFTRLFGNTNTTNKRWGTIEENGVGKFSDFTHKALQGIKQLGTTHIWYTGVPHHDVITDYSAYGISHDDPDVVKGRAGSPYAVKDYYTVNPDLADDPTHRLKEFEDLIKRTHKNGMQVIIDIVPNHVARNYSSLAKPEGVSDFGEQDDFNVEYARNNNFYYVPGKDFQVPELLNDYQPLGSEPHPLADNKFIESPAKWTGNGSRKAQPHFHDWYETVKVNYGVKPDGSYDFARLPQNYIELGVAEHAAFWADKDIPDSWKKFRDICLYWLDKGVDGFRYDMAEMVPVEFWSYLNSSIKIKNANAFLLAEVYNPDLYHRYIHLGKMDYLYDKVGFYDTLKGIMQGNKKGQSLHQVQAGVQNIEQHMLHFLENHDEQRIASDAFSGKVGGAQMGKPGLVVSALISRSPTLLYFGQEVAEDGSEDLGFGDPSRTSIFDYGGVPAHQRWMNQGQFDGGQLTASELALRNYYVDVMNISASHPAMLGDYAPVYITQNQLTESVTDQLPSQKSANKLVAFVRYTQEHTLLVVSHFSPHNTVTLSLELSAEILQKLRLEARVYPAIDLLTGKPHPLLVDQQIGSVSLTLAPMQSVVLEL